MRRWFAVLAIMAVSAGGLFGCGDNRTAVKPPATAPVTASAPVVKAAPLAAVVSVPPVVYPTRAPSVMTLDGHDIMFPAATMVPLKMTPSGLRFRLCSDDPPASIDPGYSGNSFCFDFKLPYDDTSKWPSVSSDFHLDESADDSNGIFIHGFHEQIHPADLHITFQKVGDQQLAILSGTVLHSSDKNPLEPAERIQINACLRTAVSQQQ